MMFYEWDNDEKQWVMVTKMQCTLKIMLYGWKNEVLHGLFCCYGTFLLEKNNNNLQFDSLCIREKGVDAVCCYLAALVDLWLVQYTNLIRWHISKQQ